MKKLLVLLLATSVSLLMMAQGNSQNKGKDKAKGKSETAANTKEKNDKDKNDKTSHEKKIWEGTYAKEADGPKPSKNQPAKVRSSFQRDYPYANNVTWSKYRGDWTATFRNGIWISSAVYHANGDRRDTRTTMTRNELPKVIIDDIFKKKPETKLEDVIKIQVPKAVKDIFRIKNIIEGKSEYLYYNSDGVVVQYNY
jgi:Ni/Co efflux regulator RcnB